MHFPDRLCSSTWQAGNSLWNVKKHLPPPPRIPACKSLHWKLTLGEKSRGAEHSNPSTVTVLRLAFQSSLYQLSCPRLEFHPALAIYARCSVPGKQPALTRRFHKPIPVNLGPEWLSNGGKRKMFYGYYEIFKEVMRC